MPWGICLDIKIGFNATRTRLAKWSPIYCHFSLSKNERQINGSLYSIGFIFSNSLDSPTTIKYICIFKKKIITYLCNKKYLSSSIFKTNSRSTYFATTHNTVFNCITDVFKYALSQSIHFKEIVRSPTNRATFLLYLLETRSHVPSWNKSKEYFSIEWKIYFIEIKVLQNFTISDNNNPPVNEFELIWIEPNIFVACF